MPPGVSAQVIDPRLFKCQKQARALTRDKKNMSVNTVRAPNTKPMDTSLWAPWLKAIKQKNTQASVKGKLPPQ